jgi:hypothetical protein
MHAGTVRVFRQKSALEDAIEFHAFAPFEARACVCTMSFLSGVHDLLPVGTVNWVQTLKDAVGQPWHTLTMNSVIALMASHNAEGCRGPAMEGTRCMMPIGG